MMKCNKNNNNTLAMYLFIIVYLADKKLNSSWRYSYLRHDLSPNMAPQGQNSPTFNQKTSTEAGQVDPGHANPDIPTEVCSKLWFWMKVKIVKI